MSSRRPLILGNWKMNLSLADATSLARGLQRKLAALYAGPEVGVCPSFLHLPAVREILEGSSISVGAQDCVAQTPGACTGGVSAEQLRELTLKWVILGHSERRQYFAESDADVAAKLGAAFRVGLSPVLCIGETLEQREGGQTEAVVIGQLQGAIADLEAPQVAALTVAYEPVWAIGTGRSAKSEDAQAVHRLVRGALAEVVGADAAGGVRILYGGSVNEENAAGYFACEDVDGALVGGASLDPDRFVGILRAAQPA